MKYDNNYYYLTDEEIADMRSESMEDVAKKLALAFGAFVVFGSTFLSVLLTLIGG